MSILISISSLSFLFLVTMILLRWFNCNLKRESVCYKIFKESDRYLNKQFFLIKRKTQRYKNDLSLFTYIGKFLLFQIIKLYDILNYLLKKIRFRFSKCFKKISLKEKSKTASEYLRNISDYKESNK